MEILIKGIMTKSKLETTGECKFLSTIQEIKRYNSQFTKEIENKNLKLIKKLNCDLISL